MVTNSNALLYRQQGGLHSIPKKYKRNNGKKEEKAIKTSYFSIYEILHSNFHIVKLILWIGSQDWNGYLQIKVFVIVYLHKEL